MKIQVTQEDIDRGEPAEAKCCPIALALSRTLNGVSVWVEKEYIVVNPDCHYIAERVPTERNRAVTLPPEAQYFIAEFDDNGPDDVGPFEFDLPIEQP